MLFTIGKEKPYDELLVRHGRLRKGIGGFAFVNKAEALEEARRLTAGKSKIVGLPKGAYSVYLMEGNVGDVIPRKHTGSDSTYPSLKFPRRIIRKVK